MTESLAKLYEELATYERRDLSEHDPFTKRQVEKRIALIKATIAREEKKRNETKSS